MRVSWVDWRECWWSGSSSGRHLKLFSYRPVHDWVNRPLFKTHLNSAKWDTGHREKHNEAKREMCRNGERTPRGLVRMEAPPAFVHIGIGAIGTPYCDR